MGQDLIKEKTINGHTYRVRMLDPDTAWDTLVDLLGMLGPSAAVLFGVEDGAEVSDDALAKSLAALSTGLDKAKIRDVIQRMAKVSEVVLEANKALPLGDAYKVHFAGRIGEMFQWLVFAVQSQYADFGDAFGSIPGLGIVRRSTPAGTP